MKTSFAMLYPNAIIVAAEKGYKSHVANFKDIETWDDFIELVKGLEDHREAIADNIQTMVIDTVDELYPKVGAYVCKIQGRKDQVIYKSIKDIPYGQGWTMQDDEFKKQINRIINMGFTILYLTHSKVKTIKPKNEEPYDMYISTMPDRCAAVVYPACDYIIHGYRKSIEIGENQTTLKRALTVKGNEKSVAGSRVYLKEDIVFDTEEEAMEKFIEQFKQGIIKNLEKKGIKTDIKVIEEQQKKEREAQIKENVEKIRNDIPTLIEKIKEAIKDKMKLEKVSPTEVMEILAKHNIKSPDEITDSKVAKEILDTFKAK